MVSVPVDTPLFAACPSCGYREQVGSPSAALTKANAHNAVCKQQRPKVKRERPLWGADSDRQRVLPFEEHMDAVLAEASHNRRRRDYGDDSGD